MTIGKSLDHIYIYGYTCNGPTASCVILEERLPNQTNGMCQFPKVQQISLPNLYLNMPKGAPGSRKFHLVPKVALTTWLVTSCSWMLEHKLTARFATQRDVGVLLHRMDVHMCLCLKKLWNNKLVKIMRQWHTHINMLFMCFVFWWDFACPQRCFRLPPPTCMWCLISLYHPDSGVSLQHFRLNMLVISWCEAVFFQPRLWKHAK